MTSTCTPSTPSLCLRLQGSAAAWVRANLEGFLHRDAPTPSVSHACRAACNINKYPARTGTAACMQERRGPLGLARFGCDNCAAADTSRFADRRARQQVLAVMMSTALNGSICSTAHACMPRAWHVLRYQARVRVQGQGHREPLQAA